MHDVLSADLQRLSRSQERWTPAELALIAPSAGTAPLHAVGGFTLTGDRLLGFLAVTVGEWSLSGSSQLSILRPRAQSLIAGWRERLLCGGHGR